MKIAVVILNWNGTKLLEQFLPSIVNYSPEAEIYVADNASTDGSVSFVKVLDVFFWKTLINLKSA